MSFFSKILLVLMLVQLHFPSLILCMEPSGYSSIKVAPLGICGSLRPVESCSQVHISGIPHDDCTDIRLGGNLSFTSKDRNLCVSRPTIDHDVTYPPYLGLLSKDFSYYISAQDVGEVFRSSQFFPVTYHPHQILKSTILLI